MIAAGLSAKMMLFVAAGGAVGAVGRYVMMSVAGHVFGHGFPFGTLIVNVIGSFLLAVFIEVSALAWSPSPEVRAMIVGGVLGAFTTFSAFSLDTFALIERGNWAAAGVYVGASVILALVGFFLGLSVMRMVLS